jgi:hypothetical protein
MPALGITKPRARARLGSRSTVGFCCFASEAPHTWPRILPISVAAVAYINGDAGSERDARRALRISN